MKVNIEKETLEFILFHAQSHVCLWLDMSHEMEDCDHYELPNVLVRLKEVEKTIKSIDVDKRYLRECKEEIEQIEWLLKKFPVKVEADVVG